MTLTCPYCQQPACLTTGATIYPHRADLHDKRFYHCAPCRAWVGCHPGTDKPLGRLANAELRAAKMAAHAAFDPLWRGTSTRKRSEAYRWLAGKLGIAWKDCHIGEMNVEQCRRVVEICTTSQTTRTLNRQLI